MKKYLFVLLIGICLSCEKDKYTVNSLFLENLKETSEFYDTGSKQLLETVKNRNEEMGFEIGRSDTLNSISKKVDQLFLDLVNKKKEEQINLHQKTIQSINAMNSDCKLKFITLEKLQILDDEVVYYYLKSELYKQLYENYQLELRNRIIYCGYRQISDKQQELIRIIRNSDIK